MPLPPKILIVRLGAIGDVTNALVTATALARHDPEVRIGWVVHELARPLVDGHPAVARVHSWPRGSGRAGWRALLAEIRAEHYDAAIDLQRITKSAWLARRSGARRVIGFDRDRCKGLSWLWTKERLGPASGPHRVDDYLDVARHLGVAEPRAQFELPHRPDASDWAERLVEEWGGAPILFVLGATKAANRWNPTSFGELARLCAEELGRPLAHVGSPADEPAAVRALSMTKKRHGVHSLVGRTTLPQLWELLRRAAVVVTGDTGPLHLANAVGTPCVAIFGAADPARTGPYGEGHRIVSEPPSCSPCRRRECNQPRHACMEDVEPGRVLQEVARLLKTE